MITLFVREFKAVFRNIISVVALGVIALFSGIFFTRNNLVTGYSEIEPVLLNMTLVIAVIVPLVAILSVSKERKEGSDIFVATLPFTKIQIMLGKFFGIFAACLIPLSTVALYPLVLALFGAKNVFGSYAAIIVLFAMTAFLCALGLVAAYIFKKIWQSVIASYLPLAVLLALGILSNKFEGSATVALTFFITLSVAVGACFWLVTKRLYLGVGISLVGISWLVVAFFVSRDSFVNSISRFFALTSPFKRFDLFIYGIFDVSNLVFFLSLCVALLWALALAMKPKKALRKGQRRPPAHKKTAIAAAAVLIGCFAVNVVACALPSAVMYVDVSDNRLYSLSSKTKAYMKSLDKEVTVYMIDGYKGSEDEDSIERVARYIDRYCSASSKITLKRVDPEKNPEFLEKYGLQGQKLAYCSLIVESDSRWRIVSADEYFVYYHEQQGYISASELEYLLTYYSQLYSIYYQYAQENPNDQTAVAYLQSIQENINSFSNDSVLCFCAENVITEAIEYVTAAYVPTVYSLVGRGEKGTFEKKLDIRELSKVPDDVGLLVINAPTEDYSDGEISVLSDFMARGGRIVLFVNEANGSMPNISKLLASYGLSLEKGVVSSGKIQATYNRGGTVALMNASAIKTTEVTNITVSPLLTFAVTQTEGDEQTSEAKNVAVTAYNKDVQSAISLVTGADTFNEAGGVSLSNDEEEALATFLLNIIAQMNKRFEGSVSTATPKIYTIGGLVSDNSSSGFFVALFIVIIPAALVGVPIFSAYIRKKRNKSVS